MLTNKWQLLQLFAGEAPGDGGAGAESGESSADAGQTLRDLGVPEEKIRRNRSYKPAPKMVRNTEDAGKDEQVDAAKAVEETPAEEKPKYVWEDIMKDPDMNREMQKTVKAAKNQAKAAEANLAALAPFLQERAKEYGMDPENLDYQALGKALSGGYEEKAAELGVSTDVAIKLDQQQRVLEQQKFDAHMQELERQAEELRQVFPNFDLQTEMQDPRFFRLTAPGMPFTVEDAYHAVHRKELEAAKAQAIKETTRQQIAASIAAGQRRPNEAGTTATAPSVTSFHYSRASREEREALKERIRRGEKIYPE